MDFSVDTEYLNALEAFLTKPNEHIDYAAKFNKLGSDRLFMHLLSVSEGIANTNNNTPCLTLAKSPKFTFEFVAESSEEVGGTIHLVVVKIGGVYTET